VYTVWLTMPTEYNDIAEQYKRSKDVIWRYHIEQYSLFNLLGDISGRSVLDLACGEGHYTRLLKALGASRVLGVDLSSKMIELARMTESANPVGVEYLVADAREIQFTESFDIVVAAYLLNYARTREELLAMCQAISRSLKPGGRFVTVNNNPAQHVSQFDATRKYGFVKSAEEAICDGTPIRYTFFIGSETFQIENYHLDIATHEWALEEAGLSGIRWHGAQLSPGEAAGPEKTFWSDFLGDPPVVLLECAKL
jgi:ubiquinone/menaquinone biosynthesis C-methylase UbiE